MGTTYELTALYLVLSPLELLYLKSDPSQVRSTCDRSISSIFINYFSFISMAVILPHCELASLKAQFGQQSSPSFSPSRSKGTIANNYYVSCQPYSRMVSSMFLLSALSASRKRFYMPRADCCCCDLYNRLFQYRGLLLHS